VGFGELFGKAFDFIKAGQVQQANFQVAHISDFITNSLYRRYGFFNVPGGYVTLAPLLCKAFATSYPIPVLAPVTIAVLPVKSGMFSAVHIAY